MRGNLRSPPQHETCLLPVAQGEISGLKAQSPQPELQLCDGMDVPRKSLRSSVMPRVER